MKLRVVGTLAESRHTTPVLDEILRICKKLKAGDGLTTRELANRVGVAEKTIQNYAPFPQLQKHMIREYHVGRRQVCNVYANSNTVKAYYASQNRN